MAHELFGERFYGTREPAWHGLGYVSAEQVAIDKAFELADMYYKVHKVPLVAQPAEIDGTSFPVPLDQVALMREPTKDAPNWQYYGIVGADYEVIQNEDIARILAPLSERWSVETVGALKAGRRMFVVLNAGETTLADDKLAQYFLITDGKGGGQSLKAQFTPVRVVCMNTLTSALRKDVANISLAHFAGADRSFEIYMNLIMQLEHAQAITLENFEKLAGVQFSFQDVEYVLEAAYPLPKISQKQAVGQAMGWTFETTGELMPPIAQDLFAEIEQDRNAHATLTERVLGYRNAAYERLQSFNEERPDQSNTGWATYNAVVETEDYRRPQSEKREKESLASVLFGGRAKNKRAAYEMALAITEERIADAGKK